MADVHMQHGRAQLMFSSVYSTDMYTLYYQTNDITTVRHVHSRPI